MRYFLVLVLGLSIAACEKPEQVEPEAPPILPEADPLPGLDVSDLKLRWLTLAKNCYQRAVLAARELEANSELFLSNPRSDRLTELQSRWISAHQAFISCNLYHALAFSRQEQKDLNKRILRLDAWPIEGGYVDYLPDYPYTGIVNDVTVPISIEALTNQHQMTGIYDVAIGFHSLEFLLWGADGNRPVLDFEEQSSETNEQGIELNSNNRRRAYISLLTALIIAETEALADRWNNDDSLATTTLNNTPPGAQASYLLSAVYQALSDQLLIKYFEPLDTENVQDADESAFSGTTKQGIQSQLFEIGKFLLGNGKNSQSIVEFISLQNPDSAKVIANSFGTLSNSVDKLPSDFPSLSQPESAELYATAKRDLAILISQLVQVTKDLNLTIILF